MTAKLSVSSNIPLIASKFFLLRHQLKHLKWIVATCIMAFVMNPAMAGTNGATSSQLHKPSGKSASLLLASSKHDDESRIVIRGVSLAEWTQRFWNRFMSIPVNVSPATDKTGIHCGINQAGPVWFLGAPLGGTNTLNCTIPAGKVILAPAATYINDYPCPDPSFEPAIGQTLEDFLTQGVTPIIDSFSTEVELDGKPLKLHRITAGIQSFTGAKDIAPSIDACVTGSPQLGVADGKYAVIGPLSPGQHILHIQIDSPIFGNSDNTFHLTIFSQGS